MKRLEIIDLHVEVEGIEIIKGNNGSQWFR